MQSQYRLPNQEERRQQIGFNLLITKKIWPFQINPTKFVGYFIQLCFQQHISSLVKLPLAVVAVVCRKASYNLPPRMGAGPTYSGNQFPFFIK